MVEVKLKISILGPLVVTRSLGEGPPQARTFQQQGSVRSSLLTALIMAERPRTPYELYEILWKHESPTRDEARHRASLDTAMHRLRTDLELPSAARDHIIRSAHGGFEFARPDYVLTDWDLFNDAVKNKNYEAALALVDGVPLPGLDVRIADSREWLAQVREDVTSKVTMCLEQLGISTPEFLDLKSLPIDASWRAPERWTNALADAVEIVPTTNMPHPRPRRISEVDKSAARFALSVLFDDNEEGHARYAHEMELVRRKGIPFWWSEVSSEWFGGYFAFWHSPYTVDPASIKLNYSEGRYDSARFEVPDCDGDNDKAIVVEGSNFYSDNRDHKELRLGTTTWNFAFEWAKDHATDLLDGDVPVSVFGLTDRSAYPGIAGVHTLLCTADGYLLLALRDPRVQFYPLTWSASFEESISVGARDFTGPLDGDRTVMDPILGGLYEEWGIEEDAVDTATCMAVGREYVRGENGRLDLSSSVLTAARLNIDLDAVWACLDAGNGVRDLDEHRSWAGCRFGSRTNVLRFLSRAKSQREGHDLLPEAMSACEGATDLRFYPKGAIDHVAHRGLMPTSAARLYLASDWLWRNHWLN